MIRLDTAYRSGWDWNGAPVADVAALAELVDTGHPVAVCDCSPGAAAVVTEAADGRVLSVTLECRACRSQTAVVVAARVWDEIIRAGGPIRSGRLSPR